MVIRRRMDDPESREFWRSVDEGRRRYAALPEWKKGGLPRWPDENDQPTSPTAGRSSQGDGRKRDDPER